MPQLSASTSSIIGPTKRKHNPEGTSEVNPAPPRKRQHFSLQITIPALSDLPEEPHDDDNSDLTSTSSPISGLSDADSLFDEPTAVSAQNDSAQPSSDLRPTPALRTAPPIQGLFLSPTLRLPVEIANSVTRYCLDTYFHSQGVNQVMLFGRFSTPQSGSPSASTGLPPVLLQLLSTLKTMLLPLLPTETHALLFPRVPTCARQAILNLYKPGEGISPHVDLLRRFGDGIIGVSLGSGCVMQFAKAGKQAGTTAPKDNWDVYLPERSVIVLSEDARYDWTHGIGKHTRDYVALPDANGLEDTADRWIERGVRLSITFRWLLPGADVVGEEPSSP